MGRPWLTAQGLIALLPGDPSVEAQAAVQRVCEVLELIAGALDSKSTKRKRSKRRTTPDV